MTLNRETAERSTILRGLVGSTRVVIPLKQSRGTATKPPSRAVPSVFANLSEAGKAFVGQSFAPKDERVNGTVHRFLETMGIDVITGEPPTAGSVSAKVRGRIESAEIFVGIFTRRDRIAGRQEWSTSAWVVDEKAYALAKDKKLVLIKEQGVQSIGGLQGDYEYLEFNGTNFRTSYCLFCRLSVSRRSHAAPLHNCKYWRLRAPATNFLPSLRSFSTAALALSTTSPS